MHMVAFKADPTPATPRRRRSRSPRPPDDATVNDIVPVTADASDNVGRRRRPVPGRRERSGAEDTNRAVRAELGQPHRRQRRPHPDGEGARRGRQQCHVGAGHRQRRQHRLLPERGPRHRVRPADHLRVPARRPHAGRRARRARSRSCRRRTRSPTRRRSCSSPTSARPASSRASTTSRSTPTSPRTTSTTSSTRSARPNHDRVSRFTANAALTGTVAGQRVRALRGPAERRTPSTTAAR